MPWQIRLLWVSEEPQPADAYKLWQFRGIYERVRSRQHESPRLYEANARMWQYRHTESGTFRFITSSLQISGSHGGFLYHSKLCRWRRIWGRYLCWFAIRKTCIRFCQEETADARGWNREIRFLPRWRTF